MAALVGMREAIIKIVVIARVTILVFSQIY